MTGTTAPIRPSYGKTFRCIGTACEDTCCHGWTIPMDKATYEKYQLFPEEDLRAHAKQHISRNSGDVSDTLYARIDLNEAKNCPFLTTDRLCGVQQKHGPEYLSTTCSIYPRVLNNVNDEIEVSLYLSCPEAARQVLLDPQSMQMGDGDSSSYFRMDQFSKLAGNGDGLIHKPYEYFAEIRSCIVALLQDQGRPLWQRVFLLGMLCKRLDGLATTADDATVPQILNDYRNILATGALRDQLEGMQAQPAVQLDVVLRLADLRIREGASGQRFYECFREFAQGAGYTPNATPNEYAGHYVEAEAKYLRPFFEKHPFIMENYLLNYVFRTLFPFGREASAHFTPQSIFGEYILMAAQYAVINGLLIGMAGHYREAFGTDHLIKLVQSFSKAVEHNPSYLKEVGDFIRGRSLDNIQGLAILLKN
ncbi:lysine-N-methylase [Silvibacterium bohemicum]|uniref:Lysine-N-methylase n=1 Tax=Silvibacterium bohemicum TaxID=1577686 RepID=A0A841K1F9_9BACT|nr:flagellin lysine-N-methylase [Silvibacterium bohemicum]MBB6145789.1 lysine-N-methylase [Silvibacterium bohemicum]